MARIEQFVRRTTIPVPPEEAFRWHTRPGALERLNPPWDPVEIVERRGGEGIEEGTEVVLRTRIGPFRQRWVARHTECVDGERFRDVQVEGPFARWEHTHLFEGDGNGGCVLEDRIDYALPGGALGRWLGGRAVRRKLDSVFAYRHALTARDLSAHAATDALDIHVTGSSGLVGSRLIPFLQTGGHHVHRIARRDGPDFDLAHLEGADAVVHLAGESIASGRWTAAKRDRIRRSRVEGTRRIAEHVASMERPPRVLICASAIGYYGDRGDERLDETSAAGEGFLAEVCRAWEAAAAPARVKGVRVVNLRFGVVLSPRGGALAKMLPPFRLGLGGRIGDGRQLISWISVDDAVGAILHAIENESLAGPVNAVAPSPVSNAAFTKILGGVLRRPTLVPLPAFLARLALGGMADELLLASQNVHPTRLLESGYRFRDPQLEGALRRLLGRLERESL